MSEVKETSVTGTSQLSENTENETRPDVDERNESVNIVSNASESSRIIRDAKFDSDKTENKILSGSQKLPESFAISDASDRKVATVVPVAVQPSTNINVLGHCGSAGGNEGFQSSLQFSEESTSTASQTYSKMSYASNTKTEASEFPNAQSSMATEVYIKEEPDISEDNEQMYSDLARQVSLKELEQSFLSALNMACENTKEISKGGQVISSNSVPIIKITQVIDGKEENIQSEDLYETEEYINVAGAVEQSIKTSAQVKPNHQCNASFVNEAFEDQTTVSAISIQEYAENGAGNDQECKPFFYISSSELPSEQSPDNPKECLSKQRLKSPPPEENVECSDSEYPDELRRRASAILSGSQADEEQRYRSETPSFIFSKDLHGAIFLVAFLVALLGFVLYLLAQKGQVPDVLEPIGLTTLIIAALIGVFSLLCFTFLGAYPTVHPTGYDVLNNTQSFHLADQSGNRQNRDEESWSSETERAFRRQNNMPSTHTTEVNIKSCPTDPKSLIDKADKIKKEVVGLLESFSSMVSEMEQVKQQAEPHQITKDVKKSNGKSESTHDSSNASNRV